MSGHWQRVAVTALLLLPLPTVLRAEVGMPSSSLDSQAAPYIILGIIDESPDPFGLHWERHSAQGDPTRIVLNEQGFANGDGRPSIIVNPVNRMAVVAWAMSSPTGYDIVVSHFAGGAWSAPQVVAASAADELDAALAVDPTNGQVHLFYWVDGATPQVMHREAPADLSSWSAETAVSDVGEPACRPAATVHDGVLFVSYEVHHLGSGQTPRQVVLASRQGSQFVEEVVAITYQTDDVWTEVHSKGGKLWVEWIDSAAEMAWARTDGQGGWEPTRYEPYVSQEDLQFHVRRRIRLQAIQP